MAQTKFGFVVNQYWAYIILLKLWQRRAWLKWHNAFLKESDHKKYIADINVCILLLLTSYNANMILGCLDSRVGSIALLLSNVESFSVLSMEESVDIVVVPVRSDSWDGDEVDVISSDEAWDNTGCEDRVRQIYDNTITSWKKEKVYSYCIDSLSIYNA